jgi:hypothetical protein
VAVLPSLHLLATLGFVLGSALVGVRLLLLARRTREQPELLLGSAILGTAVFGYGVLIAVAIAQGAGPQTATPLVVGLTGAGRILHAAGVTSFLLFVLRVFHPRETPARALACFAGLLLWGGLLWGAAQGSFRAHNTGSPAWWCEYAVIWTYPLWLGTDALTYWRRLRRRVAIGLADPLVTNRFALWGFGSIGTAVAIWSSSLPAFLLEQPDLLARVTPWVHVSTAAAGIASISCSYLAFLPPAWYARRFARRDDAAPAPA